MRFTLGPASVDVIADIDSFDFPIATLLPDLDPAVLVPDRALLEPDHLDLARGVFRLGVQSFLLRIGGRSILIDSCIGEDKELPGRPHWHRRTATGFLDRLRAAGVTPETVDVVFCTHLHVDHVGWNTRLQGGHWVPTFPSARYLLGRAELAHWQAQPPPQTVLAQSVQPLLEAGVVDLVDDGYQLAPGITLLPLPGHTPGQMGLRIDVPGGRAIFCGDAIHSPVQMLHPSQSTGFCSDRPAAAASRLALLETAAEQGQVVVPAHFRHSRHVTVTRDGSRFVPRFCACG